MFLIFIDVNVLNGGWHTLKLQKSSSEVSIQVDGTRSKLAADSIPFSFGRTIYFGQSPKIFNAILVGTSLSYVGCIRNLSINGIYLPIKDAKRTSFSTPLPSSGCQADRCNDPSIIQCSNNGYCVGNNSGLFCHCNNGYTGTNCEHC